MVGGTGTEGALGLGEIKKAGGIALVQDPAEAKFNGMPLSAVATGLADRIRDSIVFAQQNMIKDPPFSRLDLISCRNVLIYMGGALQKKVVPLFHYALKPFEISTNFAMPASSSASMISEPASPRSVTFSA